jgi:hypothetical protein
MAANNKSLATKNKSCRGGKATKKRKIRELALMANMSDEIDN